MIELTVLIRLTASAPPAFAARAGFRMSVMFGVSLTITGIRVCALHQRATISMYSGTWPTAEPMPRSLIPCGQPKLSSTPSAPVSSTSGRIVRHSLCAAPPLSAKQGGLVGWGARIRTWEWRNQNPLPYHLATPQRIEVMEADHIRRFRSRST